MASVEAQVQEVINRIEVLPREQVATGRQEVVAEAAEAIEVRAAVREVRVATEVPAVRQDHHLREDPPVAVEVAEGETKSKFIKNLF